MKTKMKMVTGRNDREDKDLTEILTGKRLSKFSKYTDRASYRSTLFNMGHIELMEECIRIGAPPSAEKEFSRNRCLAAYDNATKNRKLTQSNQKATTLEEIIAKG